jgi:hypothetical protein
MSELIMVIATLCATGSGSTTGFVDDEQLKCQKYYVECLNTSATKIVIDERKLPKCILDRK